MCRLDGANRDGARHEQAGAHKALVCLPRQSLRDGERRRLKLNDLRGLQATEIADLVNSGELSAAEILTAHVEALPEACDLNAIITPCAERALSRASKGTKGILAGVPLLVKDLFDTAEVTTTYGSAMYARHVPKETAAAVRRLEDVGAIVIGKTNLDEFAWGTTGQNPHWGYIQNPVCNGKVAGGSSGGNAAALSASIGVVAIGTDTGGSIRIPSACCGTVGFKPRHGQIPLAGCFPLSPTLDVAGPMARSVADCALTYSALTGAPRARARIEGMVIGILGDSPRMSPLELGTDGVPPEAREVAAAYGRHFEALGAHVVEAKLPDPGADVVPVMLYEAVSTHRDTFPSRQSEYGPAIQSKLKAAQSVTQAEMNQAKRALVRWRAAAESQPKVDLLLSSTITMSPPSHDVWEPDVRIQMVSNTRIFNFLDWPAIAIGNLQLAARDEQVLLSAALAWEDSFGSVQNRMMF